MTKGEKKERSDILYETILTLKDLDECFARHSSDLYNYRLKLSQYRGS